MKRHGTLLERLLVFDFDIKHIPSNTNVCVDFISFMNNPFKFQVEESKIYIEHKTKNSFD